MKWKELIRKDNILKFYRKIEQQYLWLEEKHKELQNNFEIVQKSRDQKDKHISVLYKENEKLKNKLEKFELQNKENK